MHQLWRQVQICLHEGTYPTMQSATKVEVTLSAYTIVLRMLSGKDESRPYETARTS